MDVTGHRSRKRVAEATRKVLLAVFLALAAGAVFAPAAAADHDPLATYSCLDATNITDTTATLNAATTDLLAASATFTLVIELDILVAQSPVAAPYSLNLTGLAPGSVYQYTVSCDPGGHDQTNATCVFATSGVAAPPGPYTCEAATDVTATSATLNAHTLDPRATTATFTLVDFDFIMPQQPVAAPYSLTVGNLSPGTTYTYRVVFNPGAFTQTNATCAFTTLLPVRNPPAAPPVDPRLPETGFSPTAGLSIGLVVSALGLAAMGAARLTRRPVTE